MNSTISVCHHKLSFHVTMTPPPPHTHTHTHALECIRGPHARSHFLGKGGIFWPQCREDFPRKPQKGDVFVIASGIQYPR